MSADVLIVGAGPTGLMLACWLARLGIRPLVIDKKEGLTRESRALAVQARTLETYDLLGIVERALPQGVQVAGVNVLVKQHRVGHQASDTTIAVKEWVYPEQSMVSRGGGNDSLRLADSLIDLLESLEKARKRPRADPNELSDTNIAAA